MLNQAFFFTVAKKLKAKKTQATKKLKQFFSQKLKVPEDFSKILAKNSILISFLNKILSGNNKKCSETAFSWIFCQNLTILFTNFTNSCKYSRKLCKNSSNSQKTQANPKKPQGFSKKNSRYRRIFPIWSSKKACLKTF